MKSLKHDVAFIWIECSERAEQGFLRGFQRKEMIVMCVDHQHGNFNPRCKIDLIDLGGGPFGVQSAAFHHDNPDAGLQGGQNGGLSPSPTEAEQGELVEIQLRTGLQVVDGPAQVFPPHDDVIAIQARGGGVVRLQVVMTLVGSFVNREYQRPAALEQQRCPGRQFLI